MSVVVKIICETLLGHTLMLLIEATYRIFPLRLIVIILVQRALIHACNSLLMLHVLKFLWSLLPIVDVGGWLIHVPWLSKFGLLLFICG